MAEGMDRSRLWIALEDLFILVSVLALWPAIVGWEGWIWEVVKYAAAGGLLGIFVMRVKRYNRRQRPPGDAPPP